MDLVLDKSVVTCEQYFTNILVSNCMRTLNECNKLFNESFIDLIDIMYVCVYIKVNTYASALGF